jgi:hypothetical protein
MHPSSEPVDCPELVRATVRPVARHRVAYNQPPSNLVDTSRTPDPAAPSAVGGAWPAAESRRPRRGMVHRRCEPRLALCAAPVRSSGDTPWQAQRAEVRRPQGGTRRVGGRSGEFGSGDPVGERARAQSSLPDASATPGAINLAVTQKTIDHTICARGWMRMVRPPVRIRRS